jgi:hypothetical protein
VTSCFATGDRPSRRDGSRLKHSNVGGDTATGRAYICELIRLRGGRSELNYAIYHDSYQRTSDGWEFTERVYEIRYLDTTPLTGSAPHIADSGR